ncbi:MAG TPA: glycosyl hydrolase [Gemmatimonadaceae bacterium]|jgi:hypothetical protein|nr:glycosyl hydrolase [Gemmatimonadaceae bacterium]
MPLLDFSQLPSTNAFGVNVNLFYDWQGRSAYNHGLDSVASLVWAAGIGWVRESFDWYLFESDSSDRDTSKWNWTWPDSSYNLARHHGLNILGILAYPPMSESSDTITGDSLVNIQRSAPRDTAGWLNYVSAVVHHYPDVRYWEIWNEPNVGYFRVYNGLSQSEEYARLVRVAAGPIHSAGDYVVGGVIAYVTSSDSTDWKILPSAFIDSVFGIWDVGDSIDVLSVHYYSTDAWTDGLTTTLNDLNADVHAAQSTSPAYGQIWVTEAGAGKPSDQADTVKNALALSQFVRVYAAGGAPSFKKLFFWHAYADSGPAPGGITRNYESGYPESTKAYREYAAYTKYAAAIEGPTKVKPNATCEWWTSVTGGVPAQASSPSYTYAWQPGSYTGEDYDYTNGGASFTMVLTVTDSNGVPAVASLPVTVASNAMTCPYRPTGK